MAEESKEPSGLYSEFAKLLPFLVSAIGLSYDVGYFAIIGMPYFGVFSLSEHIVFSLEAIPLAFVMVSFVLLCLIVYQTAISYFVRSRVFLIGALAFVNVASGALVLHYQENQMYVGVGLICVGVAFLLLCLPGQVIGRGVLSLYLVGAAMGVAFVTGAEVAYHGDEEQIGFDTLVVQTGEVKGRLLRSGDKRLLFYDSEKKTTAVYRWDDVKKVEH